MKTNIMKAARDELLKCRSDIAPEEKAVACQQAAEKAWAHVHRTARNVLGIQGKYAPGIVKDALGEMVLKEPEKMHLLQEYMLIEGQLHGDCFYDQAPYACESEFLTSMLDRSEKLAVQLKRELPRYKYVVQQAARKEEPAE